MDELYGDLESDINQDTPVWAIFGDLMAGLVGVFVLLLIWVLGYQLELTQSLQEEVSKRQFEEQRRMVLEEVLEEALAAPLAEGRITLQNGRIGISGSVLFALNSAELQSNGRELLNSLVTPLQSYLGEREEVLMVSGFTDDLPIHDNNLHFQDNWELSAQRALTVTRALIQSGMPRDLVFAAAFGPQQPVSSNSTGDGRSRNRRVEIAPVPLAASSRDSQAAEGG